jgi:CRP/FNR family cyclic AMP-dependent transcriptional regulator
MSQAVDTAVRVPETGSSLGARTGRMRGLAMAKHDRQKLLSQVALFSACTSKELDRLARHAELVDFPAGAVLMTEGEPGHEFYVIVDGEVGVSSGGETVAKLGPGAYVGEQALLDPAPRTATVTALRDVSAVLLSSREFYAAIDDVPGLTRKLLAGMARRLRESATQPPAT